MDALTDSVMTLAQQNRSSGTTMTPRGFNPLHEYNDIVRREGARSLFMQKEADYDRQYRTFKPSDFRHPMSNPEFRYLVSIIRTCAAHRIPLILFTYPYHARYFELLHSVGLWQSFEVWKARLPQVVGQTAVRAGSDVKLFDFAQEYRYSNDPVPPAGDRRSQMRWYWEAGHFKSALGERIIARIVGQGENGTPFGREMELTANDLTAAPTAGNVAERKR